MTQKVTKDLAKLKNANFNKNYGHSSMLGKMFLEELLHKNNPHLV
jgi:hypothetical protein